MLDSVACIRHGCSVRGPVRFCGANVIGLPLTIAPYTLVPHGVRRFQLRQAPTSLGAVLIETIFDRIYFRASGRICHIQHLMIAFGAMAIISSARAILLSIAANSQAGDLPSLDWQAKLGFILTFLKVPLTFLAVIVLLLEHSIALNITIAVTMVLDLLDGMIFERSSVAAVRHLRESRRVWDSFLDRLFMFAVLIPATLFRGFPTTSFAIISVREMLLWIITAIPYVRSGFVHRPNLPSRVGTALAGIEFMCFTAFGEHNYVSILPVYVSVASVGLVLYKMRPRPI